MIQSFDQVSWGVETGDGVNKEGYDGIVQLETRKHAYGLIPGMKTSFLSFI